MNDEQMMTSAQKRRLEERHLGEEEIKATLFNAAPTSPNWRY
jgi:hypothetical protein